MQPISAVIITFNEEKYIGRCLDSLEGVVDEIVVVDSHSTDRTQEICRAHGCRVIPHEFEGYVEQKNWAMGQASHNWILSLDGDEMLSETLRQSIQKVKQDLSRDGYYMNRLNNYYGQWIHHSGEYPDRKLRLFDRRRARWERLNPHDLLLLKKGSSTGYLKGDLLHFAHDSRSEHVAKTEKFAEIAGKALYQQRGRSTWIRILMSPLWRFMWNYFFRLGFLDGRSGLFVCYTNARQSYLKHLNTRKEEDRDKK
jgi:glycosyltransferase involved in cell wall biosynthesis